MEHETALDLSLPKLKRPLSENHEGTLSSPSSISEGDSPQSVKNEEFVKTSPAAKTPESSCSSDTDVKLEDCTTSPKRRKFSLYTPGDNSPSTPYVTRNAEEHEGYFTNDSEQRPFQALNVDHHTGGLIKRTNQGVSVCLHDEELWRAFASFGTEMIINRGGRRMFPHIILSIEGLVPQMLYSIVLEIVPADQRRYKFIHNTWMPMGMADPGHPTQHIIHPDSPNVGSFWMQNRSSFSKVRLTNNKESSTKKCSDGNILLLSMHKYKVVIKIREESTAAKSELTFEFDESAFVAVTAYQNSQITQLKIQNNPFAKAFRDCHNAPFAQKSVTPRRRDSKSKDNTEFSVSPTLPPTIPGPVNEFQKAEVYSFPYASLPYQQSSVNMAAYDQLCRDAAGRSPMFPGPYLHMPWPTMGQHWPYPMWAKETQNLMSSLYSKTLAALSPEVGCMRLPVDVRRSPDCTDTESKKQANSP